MFRRALGPKLRRTRAGGFFLIVILLLVAAVAILALALSAQMATNASASGSHVGAVAALFASESGLEYEQRRWAQNLEWYRSTTDPDPTAPSAQAIGTASFTSYANLAGTLTKTTLSTVGTTLTAFSTDRFPATGILQVGDDVTASGEFVRYTGASGGAFTGLTRGQTVGSVTSTAGAHPRGETVYPVTLLRTTMAANCTALASIQVDAHTKFLSAGTLDIEGEEISYRSSTTVGATMTLSGITRCLGTITSVSHAIGQPVTPVLVGGDTASYQVEIFATGTKGTQVRSARRTIRR